MNRIAIILMTLVLATTAWATTQEQVSTASDCQRYCGKCVDSAKDAGAKNSCVAMFSGCCGAGKRMNGWTCTCI